MPASTNKMNSTPFGVVSLACRKEDQAMTREETFEAKKAAIYENAYAWAIGGSYTVDQADAYARSRVGEWVKHCRERGDRYGDRYALPRANGY